ncbi:MAG TPA: radical SAM protein [Candidatus Lokiarchaeia archaeon]
MALEIINVNEASGIPLFGIDFLGIIDRGTNIIEIKPLTLCNLKCKYCFVRSGDYVTNFIVNSGYLLSQVKKVVEIKGNYDIEIHIAPYGEALLYPSLYGLIKDLWEIKGIETISMQSNGLLLTDEIIKRLDDSGLTRINISLNTLNEKLAESLCNCKNYNVKKFRQNIETLLNSKIDILFAPVWFPKKNEQDIEDIIKYVVELRNRGYSEKKVQIGIQKYLVYKTGRKLKNVHPKSWDYFYQQLAILEKKYSIKLKLGPLDFGIHKRKNISNVNYKKGDIIELQLLSKGRWKNEIIGKIEENYGIKVLLNKPLTYSNNILGKKLKVKIIKASYRDNILTALYPF